MSDTRSTGTTDRYIPGSYSGDIVDGEIIGDVVISPEPSSDAPPVPAREPGKPARLRFFSGWRLPRPPFFLLSLILLVIVPSMSAQFYLAFIASDQYQASTHFAVRSASDQAGDVSSGTASASAALAEMNIAGQDAHIVVDYIRSRSIIDDLANKIDIKAIYHRPEGDFWARLKKKPTAEELTDYWRTMVTVNLDGPSGIITLYVKAFRAEDALNLSRAVTSACEVLINDVSQRARADTVARAEAELRRSEGMVRQALDDMREFRDKVGYLDPVASATMTSKLITEAMTEKIRIENELFVGQKLMSNNAPSLNALQTRLTAVNDQIDRLKAKLTSGSNGDSPISQSLVRFEELELKRVFAEKLYTMSQDALERARVRASRQNVYVDVFVPAALPQEARFPERLSLSIVIPITLMVIWGIINLLIATVEDHRV